MGTISKVNSQTRPGSSGAISLVNTATENGADSTTCTIDITGLSSEDDLVIVAFCQGGAGTTTITGPSGYTELCDLYSDDTVDTSLSVYYKVQTATPDTTVVCTSSRANSYSGVAYVFSGVDTTTPIDVTTTTATGISDNEPDPPSITPTTAGAQVIAVGGHGSAAVYATTYPAGYSTGIQAGHDSGYASNIAMARKQRTSGAEDPGKFTGGNNNPSTSRAACTIALRPA